MLLIRPFVDQVEEFVDDVPATVDDLGEDLHDLTGADSGEIGERLRASWIGWMQGLAVDMTVTGLLLYIGFTLIDLDFAILFAVLAALFSVVPYYGAFASGLPAALFALADSPGKAALTLGIYVAWSG